VLGIGSGLEEVRIAVRIWGQSKKGAHYRPAAEPAVRCDRCKHMFPPLALGGCRLVRGAIRGPATCDEFARRAVLPEAEPSLLPERLAGHTGLASTLDCQAVQPRRHTARHGQADCCGVSAPFRHGSETYDRLERSADPVFRGP
jgi:hypothetical protein